MSSRAVAQQTLEDVDPASQDGEKHAAADSDQKYPSDELIKQTLDLWQPHTERTLTAEDAREMIENVVGYFRLLQAWKKKRMKANAKKISLRVVGDE